MSTPEGNGVRNARVERRACDSGPAILCRRFQRPRRRAIGRAAPCRSRLEAGFGQGGRVDHVALRHIGRPYLATTSIRVGASDTSLDLWYVDPDVTADDLSCFKRWLSDVQLPKAERFHSDLDQAHYIVGRAALRHMLAHRRG